MSSYKLIFRGAIKWCYHRMPLPLEYKRFIRASALLFKQYFERVNGSSTYAFQDPSKSVFNASLIISQIRLRTVRCAPEVSIIIPCYNQLSYTLACLRSISQNPPSSTYEVIVIDDASPDDNYSVLDSCIGIHLIHNTENLGYLESCNRAIGEAHGNYIYLINNDVMLLPGSIDALLETFKRYPNAGLVGSKLIYPNGVLQEAGGIVWDDGSAWNFGRNKNPRKPKYNYLRSVDYCSAASIMLPAVLFKSLQGFDPVYKPAYYEDTDLAQRVRQLGFEVLYQPASKVIHFEGISHGKSLSKGLKKHQLVNKSVFFERWQEKLRKHRPNGLEPDREKDRGFSKRVLLVDKCTPTADRDAGSLVLLNLMLILRHLGFQPTFIPDDNYAHVGYYTSLCQSLGIECLYTPFVYGLKQHLRQVGDRYDLVILFRPDVACSYIKAIRALCPSAKLLYYPHDLHYIRYQREASVRNSKRLQDLSLKSKSVEIDNVRGSDCTIVVSSLELKELTEQLPDSRVELLPLIANDQSANNPRPTFGGFNICFVGSFNHSPNQDAVAWFLSDIYPIIVRQIPFVHFHIVGADPPPSVLSYSSDAITVHGFVDNLDLFFSKMNVSAVPLRFGAGMKGKIVSAMRCGLPIVSTQIGSEGMQLVNGENIVIANQAQEFASAIVNVMTSKSTWEELSANGLEHCSRSWGREAAITKLQSILSSLSINSSVRGGIHDFPLYPFS